MRSIKFLLCMACIIIISSCTQLPSEPIVVTVIIPYGSDRTPTPITSDLQIMGANKAQVDALLHGWSVRQDRTSTSTTMVYRYTLDVTLIVALRNDQVIGVYVIDNPGSGVIGIPPKRAEELVTLIGGIIDPNSLVVDESGFREFGVGDVTSW